MEEQQNNFSRIERGAKISFVPKTCSHIMTPNGPLLNIMQGDFSDYIKDDGKLVGMILRVPIGGPSASRAFNMRVMFSDCLCWGDECEISIARGVPANVIKIVR